jgi:hypothetical protein
VVTLAVSEAIFSHRDLAALFRKLASALHRVARFDYHGCTCVRRQTMPCASTFWRPTEPNVSHAGLPLGETPPGWVLQTKAGTCMT